MTMKHVFAAAALAAVMSLGAAAPAQAQMAEGVAAIVNDRVISTFDVRQRAGLLLISSGVQATPELQQRARAQALRDLIDERLQLDEAAEYNVHVSQEEVTRRLADIARSNNTTVEGLATSFSQAGISINTLRAQIEADVAWRRLMAGMYGSRLRISEVEVRETQERIAAAATRPQYLLSEIFLPAETEQEFTDMQQGAMRLLEQMQQGAPFPLVARQFSRAPSAAAGGDLGWIASTELAPELQPYAERLQQGQVSLPIRAPNGVYLLAMRDRRAGTPAGASNQVALRQISVPIGRQSQLERVARRLRSCETIERDTRDIEGVNVLDLGTTTEADLSPAIRDRVSGVAVGQAAPVQPVGDSANTFVVCSRQTGGGGVPDRQEIEERLRESEMSMLAERYLRNLRREATIITRQQ